GGRDIFVIKIDAAGNYLWTKIIGGTGTDAGHSIAINDATGSVFVAGLFAASMTLIGNSNTDILTAAGTNDIFLAKFDTAGNYIWARNMGNIKGSDNAPIVATDNVGNVWVAGFSAGTAAF